MSLVRHAAVPVPTVNMLPNIDWTWLVQENAVIVALEWALNFWHCHSLEHRGLLIYDRYGLHEAGCAVLLLLCIGSGLDVKEAVGIPEDIKFGVNTVWCVKRVVF